MKASKRMGLPVVATLVLWWLIVDSVGWAFLPAQKQFRLTTTNRVAPALLLKMSEDPSPQEEGSLAAVNVLGTALRCCCSDVRGTGIGTGFYRNGYCSTGEQDVGRHTVCVKVTTEFLKFSQSVGNDLSRPMPQYMFPGLKDGDLWCLCAQRWLQSYQAGMAPRLVLKATHEKTLSYVPFEVLRAYALDQNEADQALDALNEQRERLRRLL